jgi:hypothetical protein
MLVLLLAEESAQELLQRVLLVEESAQELLQRVRQELGLMQVLRRRR